MFSQDPEVILTVLVSTALLLFFGAMIAYFIFKYQRKRHEHSKEVLKLKESFAQTLLKSKVEIQEQTLDHISKELHSNISQIASLININLSALIEKKSFDESLTETKALAKQLLSELKMISASLNTDYIMKIGFGSALENELLRVSKSMQKPAVLSKSGEELRLSPDREIILFRLCQEVLNNSIRYSRATQIKANLVYLEDRIELELSDNGIGFDPNTIMSQEPKTESTGLINIKKRAEVIDATLEIQSTIDSGTKVSIEVTR